MSRCAETECRHNDHVRGCKVIDSDFLWQRFGCDWGQFVTFIADRFGHLGEWSFRRVGSYNDVLVATLKGPRGKVEVWGGAHHQNEVWAVPKSGPRCLMGTLLNLETVEMGCNRVGVQPVLDLVGEHQ